MLQQFFKFCVVGGSGVIVDFGITYVCKEWFKLNKYVANSLGFTIAASTNYLLNRCWTFHSHNDMPTEYFKFFGIAIVGLGINNAIIYLLTKKFKLNFYLSKLFATFVVTIWNFIMNSIFTFHSIC